MAQALGFFARERLNKRPHTGYFWNAAGFITTHMTPVLSGVSFTDRTQEAGIHDGNLRDNYVDTDKRIHGSTVPDYRYLQPEAYGARQWLVPPAATPTSRLRLASPAATPTSRLRLASPAATYTSRLWLASSAATHTTRLWLASSAATHTTRLWLASSAATLTTRLRLASSAATLTTRLRLASSTSAHTPRLRLASSTATDIRPNPDAASTPLLISQPREIRNMSIYGMGVRNGVNMPTAQWTQQQQWLDQARAEPPIYGQPGHKDTLKTDHSKELNKRPEY
jgi:hypothetical protein